MKYSISFAQLRRAMSKHESVRIARQDLVMDILRLTNERVFTCEMSSFGETSSLIGARNSSLGKAESQTYPFSGSPARRRLSSELYVTRRRPLI